MHPLRSEFRRHFISAVCFTFLFLSLSSALAAKRPNILFIMADDRAAWAQHAEGYAQAYSPNMDHLLKSGAWFSNAFTPTPVCSPARASIMTSRYGTELGITDWINPKVEFGLGLDPKFLTWPEILQKAGYQTALIGKWHLGDLDNQHPTKRGYDYFMGFRGGGNSPKDPVMEKDGKTGKIPGYIVDIVAEEAMAWLQKRDPNKPFALSVHFREPHASYLPVRDFDWAKVKDMDPAVPEPDYPGLDTPRVKRMMREYLASVAALDRNIGRILKMVDDLKLKDDTIVICTADHGYNMGHHGIWHKGNGAWILKPEALPPATPNIPKGQRPNMYDTSLRIPLVIRWPGVIKPGTVISHTVSHLDWLPTFADLVGAKIPQGTIVRGRDILPVIRGKVKNWDEDYYAEYTTKHQSHTHMRTYRTPDWKLIRDFNNEGRDELYDLKNDPKESHNLIDDKSPRVQKAIKQLDARILAKMTEVKDPELALAQKRIGH